MVLGHSGCGAVGAAIEVGEGPTGVALHEAMNRLYVLNRNSPSVAVVNTSGLIKIDDEWCRLFARMGAQANHLVPGRAIFTDGQA